MRKYYQSIIVAISLAFVIGCQTTTETFFQPGNNDTSINTAVLEAMLNNEYTSTLTVHVETINGAVVLSGYVKTIRQSDTCEAVARKTPGVKSVQNNIIVRK